MDMPGWIVTPTGSTSDLPVTYARGWNEQTAPKRKAAHAARHLAHCHDHHGLMLAFFGGLAAHKLRLPPLVGYLLAGVALGPFTPGFLGTPISRASFPRSASFC